MGGKWILGGGRWLLRLSLNRGLGGVGSWEGK